MGGEIVRVVQWEGDCLGRIWTALDVFTAFNLLGMHGLALLAPFHFNWSAFWTAIALYYATGLCVTVSFHRNLAHRSFKVPKWLEYSLAYIGVLSLQGSPIDWVSTHRIHHRVTDTSSDPHTPLKGFWYSHVGWTLDSNSRFGSNDAKLLKNVGDLKKQWFYRFLHYTWVLHLVSLGIVLYAIGGLPFVVWGMGVRNVGSHHMTFLINSICHMWGKRAWDTPDLSTNNWLLGVLTLGEGWHNNHHAFEYSARLGLQWWQIDIGWYFIFFLEAIGLAADVKLPSETQMKQKALSNKLK